MLLEEASASSATQQGGMGSLRRHQAKETLHSGKRGHDMWERIKLQNTPEISKIAAKRKQDQESANNLKTLGERRKWKSPHKWEWSLSGKGTIPWCMDLLWEVDIFTRGKHYGRNGKGTQHSFPLKVNRLAKPYPCVSLFVCMHMRHFFLLPFTFGVLKPYSMKRVEAWSPELSCLIWKKENHL